MPQRGQIVSVRKSAKEKERESRSCMLSTLIDTTTQEEVWDGEAETERLEAERGASVDSVKVF